MTYVSAVLNASYLLQMGCQWRLLSPVLVQTLSVHA
jgi:hypothetical protein